MSNTVRFNTSVDREFYAVLRQRVNAHFTDKNISRHANSMMVIKSIFMLSLYFAPLILMLTGLVTGFWPNLIMWVLMGFGMSGIGMAVMHDANHGSYSKNKKVNKFMGFMVNFVGGYHVNWIIQHNVLHHTYTNIHGFDEDIEQAVMRFTPNQKRHPFYRFQIIYAPFLYGLLTIYWVLVKDFIQLVNYSKRKLINAQGLTPKKAMRQIVFNKLWYFVLTIVLPIVIIDLPWWQTLIGFLTMHFISGLILALIFQPAHVVENTDFFVPGEDSSVENNWAIHQMKTTANFANKSVFFSWFVGGLNYQIEHHLFPNICHVHYKSISHIVRSTAEEFQVPYNEYKTFFGALKSHFTLLNQLGTGKYDKLHQTSPA